MEMDGNVRRCKEMYGNVWKCKEMQGDVCKCKEMYGNVWKGLMTKYGRLGGGYCKYNR